MYITEAVKYLGYTTFTLQRLDRDFNVSLNILRQAMSEVKYVENRKQIDLINLTFIKISSINQLDSMNRESKLNMIK